MAARNLSFLKCLDREAVVLFGGGTGAGDADLTAIVGAGVSSIPDTATTGELVITLTDKWANLLFFSGTVIDPGTPDDWEVVVLSEDVASAKTITIKCFKGGTAADLSTDEKLKFMAILSNTKQPPTAR